MKGAVLICHGIGEVVSQWFAIQRLLAEHGIASLVFDYSGYGRSSGRPDPTQLEQDALSAFERLSELVPVPVSLLGFSLGTGVVVAIEDRVHAHRLVLCAPFTSFRDAARCVGIPRWLSALVPPVWETERALRSVAKPVMIVHSTGDRLFPVALAERLHRCCANHAQLRVVQGLRHNEPFYNPTQDYWKPIAEFLMANDSE